MSQGSITVKQAGPLALIQDAGRFGVGHLGVTQSGAADWISFRWANWLLGNPLNSALYPQSRAKPSVSPAAFRATRLSGLSRRAPGPESTR